MQQAEDEKIPEKYSKFFSLSLDLICIADFQGNFRYLNPAWTKNLGWPQQELLAKPSIALVHPEDKKSTIWHYKKLLEGIDIIDLQNRYLCQDGSYTWLSWNATVCFEDNLIYAVARNINLQKQREISLNQSFQELENLKFALNVHSLVAITDAKGIITYANDKFCEVSQYSCQELLGQDHRIINSGYHPQEFFQNLWRTISQGKIWKGEIKNKAKDGSFYWVDTLIVPMFSADNKPQQYVAIRTDITQRKLSELALLERSRLSLLSAEVSLSLSQSGTLSEILQHCANTISQYLKISFVGIWTLETQSQQLQLQAGLDCNNQTCVALTDTKEFPEYMVWINTILGLMNQTYGAIVNQEVRIHHQLQVIEPKEAKENFSAYPLIVEQELIGIMALFSQESFTEVTHNLLNWINNNIAVAIDRIRAREELLSRREALLLGLASQIRSSLDLDTILETAVNEIRILLQIDRCNFLRYLPNSPQPSLTITHESRNLDFPSLLGNISPEKSNLFIKTLLNQELICINDVNHSHLDQNMQQFLNQFGITSQLLLPVKSNSGELGAIICSHCSGKHIWNNSEIALLQAVTDQLAIAIDHAELYNQSLAATVAAQTQAEQLSEALHKLQETQAQLIQQEKMSSLGQLVAGVAHEINNPVNFIHGNLSPASEYIQDLFELLKLYQKNYPNPEPEIKDFAEEIDLDFLAYDLDKLVSSMKIGTNRIREIVLSLRNFSRLDEAEMKAVDIHEGIDSTLLILQNRLKAKPELPGIEIIKEYGNLPLVECYPGQINQVFMNIINNAIDALNNYNKQPSQLDIKNNHSQIRIHTKIANNNRVLVQISDNGPGMTEDVKWKLFDPFFTTKPVGQGTGLGLSISYQIVVEKHSGRLWCDSELGKGTNFWIEIPLKQQQQQTVSKTASVSQKASA